MSSRKISTTTSRIWTPSPPAARTIPIDVEDDLEDLGDDAGDIDTGSDDEESDDLGDSDEAPRRPARPPMRKQSRRDSRRGRGIAEPSEKDKASGDFVWDEEESEALRQARKDVADATADSVSRLPQADRQGGAPQRRRGGRARQTHEAGLYATSWDGRTHEKGEAARRPAGT